jgi:hypothetical protein
MRFDNMKVVAALWVVAMCAVGLAFGVTSVAGWIILAGLAVMPPIFVLGVWSEPAKTMSESIHEARR